MKRSITYHISFCFEDVWSLTTYFSHCFLQKDFAKEKEKENKREHKMIVGIAEFTSG
jgi:hypothetical protein